MYTPHTHTHARVQGGERKVVRSERNEKLQIQRWDNLFLSKATYQLQVWTSILPEFSLLAPVQPTKVTIPTHPLLMHMEWRDRALVNKNKSNYLFYEGEKQKEDEFI